MGGVLRQCLAWGQQTILSLGTANPVSLRIVYEVDGLTRAHRCTLGNAPRNWSRRIARHILTCGLRSGKMDRNWSVQIMRKKLFFAHLCRRCRPSAFVEELGRRPAASFRRRFLCSLASKIQRIVNGHQGRSSSQWLTFLWSKTQVSELSSASTDQPILIVLDCGRIVLPMESGAATLR